MSSANKELNSKLWSAYDKTDVLKLHVDFQSVGQEVEYSFSTMETAETHVHFEWRRPVPKNEIDRSQTTSVKNIRIPVSFMVPDNRNETDVNNFLQFKRIYDHPLFLEEGNNAGQNNHWYLDVKSPMLRNIKLTGTWDKTSAITVTEAIGEHALTWDAVFIVHNFTKDLWTRYLDLVTTDENSSVRFPRPYKGKFDYGHGLFRGTTVTGEASGRGSGGG